MDLYIVFCLFVACVITAFAIRQAKGIARSDEQTTTAIETERRNLRHRLREDAYWFSEDVPTMQLITGLAAGENVADLRDAWRKERAAAHAPAPLATPPAAWVFEPPYYIYSEDCMGNPTSCWRVSATRPGQDAIGYGATAEQATADCWRRMGIDVNPGAPPPSDGPRTRAQVLAARVTHSGCCERFADRMACECLKNAVEDGTKGAT